MPLGGIIKKALEKTQASVSCCHKAEREENLGSYKQVVIFFSTCSAKMRELELGVGGKV